MTTLDSRLLHFTDCFAHRFSTPGTFRYDVSPLPSMLVPRPADRSGDGGDALQVVVVQAADQAAQRQHHVTVSVVHGRLTASPHRLEVSAGDLVCWSADRSVTTGYVVRGRINSQTVDSTELHHESVFTHAFGVPGDVEWVDARGSGLRGRVRVVHPDEKDERHARWTSSIAQGTLVHVTGERAEPAEIEILVGQTVFWAVEDAPGVTITDASRLR
jgi:plastocyanin